MSCKYSRWSSNWLFYSLFLGLLVINFLTDFFGISYMTWHLMLHFGIIFFSFLVLFYSLEFSSKSSRWVMTGSLIWIIIESGLFLSHVFGYSFFENSLLVFMGSIVGLLMMLKGLGGAVDG